MSNLVEAKKFFNQESVTKKFQEILGQKSKGFITSVLQLMNSNDYLAKADPKTVYASAMIAATLDLNINNSLGYAYIVPYKGQAQFQIGYKGLIQLAQRTGEYSTINAVEIRESNFISWNPLTEELEVDYSKPIEGEIVGYAAIFKLLNGFSKVVYWTKEQVNEHAKKYSQSYTYKSSPWTTNFDEMAKKTVLKNALSKYGIMSVEMQRATVADQAVITNYDTESDTIDIEYVDNPENAEIEEKKPVLDDLQGAITSVEMGMASVQDLSEHYELTEDQITALQEVENEQSSAK